MVTREKKMKTENNARTQRLRDAVQTTNTNNSTPITPFYMQLQYSISPVTRQGFAFKQKKRQLAMLVHELFQDF